MIAEPNRHRPWLQALFAAAFCFITGYAFTTARAVEEEKPLPPKERSRETTRGGGAAETGESPRGGDGGAMERSSFADRVMSLLPKGVLANIQTDAGGKMLIEGEAANISQVIQLRDALTNDRLLKRWDWSLAQPTLNAKGTTSFIFTAAPMVKGRDGEGERKGPRDSEGKKSGMRDGDRPREGARDGEKPRTGERDGDKPRSGTRDGEGVKAGARDGERKRGTRDGDGGRSSEGAPTKAAADRTGAPLVLRVTDAGAAVRVGDETVPMNRLRGYLQGYLPQHTGAKVIVTGDPDVPYNSLTETIDAVRDNGNKNVSIQAP